MKDTDRNYLPVMPGLEPGIHEFPKEQFVDGRAKPGHDAAKDELINKMTGELNAA